VNKAQTVNPVYIERRCVSAEENNSKYGWIVKTQAHAKITS